MLFLEECFHRSKGLVKSTYIFIKSKLHAIHFQRYTVKQLCLENALG